MVTDANRLPPSPEEEITNTATSVRAMEELLKYRFKNTTLLEEALTLLSNYQRLAFAGDATFGLAILTYLDVDCGKLTDLRSATVSTGKLARVAVRHGLYNYIRGDSAILNEKSRERDRSCS